MPRVILVLLLVQGLAPGLAEVGEAVVHYAWTGHLAHTQADRGDLGDQGEHGCGKDCGTAVHHCRCCPSQAAVSPSEAKTTSLEGGDEPCAPPRPLMPPLRGPARPFRPPIS